jgi:phosphate transport system substrate-binding protein
MKFAKTLAFASISALALAACGDSGGGGGTRDSIRAVGSSTVYPFAKLVGERFARANPEFKAPLIESTGTGGGMNLFCSGIGMNTPDVTNASRRMKASEFANCQSNGVNEIIEIQIGLDGLAFASAQGGITMNLTPKIVYEAIAARPYGREQTAKTWSDVDPSLPDQPILVYGPPSTSGTRDSLKELILQVGCETNPEMKALKGSDEDRYDQVCTEVRSDGAYVDQGEQDNLIVQKIQGNSTRGRRVRLLVSRGKLRQAPGPPHERSPTERRNRHQRRLPRRAGNVHLRQEGAPRGDSGPEGVSRHLGRKHAVRRTSHADRHDRRFR